MEARKEKELENCYRESERLAETEIFAGRYHQTWQGSHRGR